MVILDERADLRVDGGSIKAHHKELPHLPIETAGGIEGQR